MLLSTIPDSGEFRMILPDGKTSNNVKDFIDMHKEWFKQTRWTYESKIIAGSNGPQMGYVVVNAMYREEERNGKSYFHNMFISYNLKLINGNWYVISDHSSTRVKYPK